MGIKSKSKKNAKKSYRQKIRQNIIVEAEKTSGSNKIEQKEIINRNPNIDAELEVELNQIAANREKESSNIGLTSELIIESNSLLVNKPKICLSKRFAKCEAQISKNESSVSKLKESSTQGIKKKNKRKRTSKPIKCSSGEQIDLAQRRDVVNKTILRALRRYYTQKLKEWVKKENLQQEGAPKSFFASI